MICDRFGRKRKKLPKEPLDRFPGDVNKFYLNS